MTADWRRQAACLGLDTNLFFPENGKHEGALLVCAGCGVREPCRDFAMSFDIDLHGVFGGMTPQQRYDWKHRHERRTTWPYQG